MSTTVTSPRIGHFPSSSVAWSDGTLFNGFLLVAYIPPTLDGISYSETDFGLISPTETLPQFAFVPIVNGLINQSLGLYFSQDVSPPSSTYRAYFYDTTRRLISGPGSAFSVTADPMTTLTIPTLTAPSAGGTPPSPDS